ncbi:CBM_collapsed_G0024460.mRNA.1.CDS.1 [Saccharomyces cerevisiae]|nr:CBM_collapsed_G0024460.mRNA.1.CDS.1 [Saccharomyces cerevisiae]
MLRAPFWRFATGAIWTHLLSSCTRRKTRRFCATWCRPIICSLLLSITVHRSQARPKMQCDQNDLEEQRMKITPTSPGKSNLGKLLPPILKDEQRQNMKQLNPKEGKRKCHSYGSCTLSIVTGLTISLWDCIPWLDSKQLNDEARDTFLELQHSQLFKGPETSMFGGQPPQSSNKAEYFGLAYTSG